MSHGVVVFDIDGVLVDSSQRYDHCQSITKSRREFWNCFFDCSLLYLDRPNERLIQLARAFKALGWRVIILTGRTEAMRDCTEEELRQFGVPFDEVVMRKNGDFRKAGEYKRDVVRGLGGVFDRIITYDDDPSVVSTLRGLGVVVVPVSLLTPPAGGVQKNLASNQPTWLSSTRPPSIVTISRAL
jgi:phosphoglycolate phosphatase-like HAD superfamily hydrolase